MRSKHFGGLVPRRVVAVAVVLAVGVSARAGRIADASDSSLTSEQVAAEIVRVQGTADETAQRWAEAEQRSEDLAIELKDAESKLAATSAEFAQLESDLAQIAVDRFTGSSGNSVTILFGDPSEEMQVNVLRSVALDVGETDLDRVDALLSDLDDERTHVAALQAENVGLIDVLESTQVELDTQLADLGRLREHLKDEEVKRAYEEQLARQRQEVADQQARAQAATTSAPVAPVRGSGGQSNPPSVTAPSTSPGAQSSPVPSPVVAVPAPAPVPEPPPAASVGGDGWVCPVAGPTAFGDTWGAARPGGRTHQGVDMMSPLGTPLVAVVAGSVTMKTNSLGGNVIWLTGVDGAKYYYAHLSSWEGGSRGVSGGEVIGYVGATGNTSANHLHFEIHPGGGAAVNPYPTVRQYC